MKTVRTIVQPAAAAPAEEEEAVVEAAEAEEVDPILFLSATEEKKFKSTLCVY